MRQAVGGVRKQHGRWLGLWYEDGVKRSKVLGLAKDMNKGEAREAIALHVRALRARANPAVFRSFVEGPFFGFYSRKWKASSRGTATQRIVMHLVGAFGDRELGSFSRDELQDFLDRKATTLSFSVVDHLRWDLKAIFDFGMSEGMVQRNPALLLFTPKYAKKPVRRVMAVGDANLCFQALGPRERLIAKLGLIAGLRPGEIFGLTWGRMSTMCAEVRQRVYRGVIDTPKSDHSLRDAALSTGLFADLLAWRSTAVSTAPEAYVFPSERGTVLSKDNCWRRNMLPKLKSVGLEWCNFQVMRRSHATLMRELKADPKLVATQLGHSVDVSLNVYSQAPLAGRVLMVNELEQLLLQ